MKTKLAILISALCCGTAVTFAPIARAQSGDAAAKLHTLSQELGLTPKQKLEMLPILKEEVPKMERIKNDSSLSRMQKIEQLRAVHRESAPQMERILSPAQYAKLQKIRREEIERAVEKRRG